MRCPAMIPSWTRSVRLNPKVADPRCQEIQKVTLAGHGCPRLALTSGWGIRQRDGKKRSATTIDQL